MSQSDIITVLKNTDGVEQVAVPLVRLARSVGSLIVRERVSSSLATYIRGDEQTMVSTTSNLVWLLDGTLSSPTVDGGGDGTSFRAVRQGDRLLSLQTVQPLTLGSSPFQAYIIGNLGLSIPGYSDDGTLSIQFPTATDEALEEERVRRTANKVLVSLPVGQSPTDFEYHASYAVGASEGVSQLQASSLEYFTEGSYDFTYVEQS